MTAPGNQFEHLHIRAPQNKRGVAVIKSRVTKAPLPFTVMRRTGTETRKRERLLEKQLANAALGARRDGEEATLRVNVERLPGDTAVPRYQDGDAAK